MSPQINKYRRLSMVSTIGSCVSIFIGGTPLALVSLGIGINARRKMKQIVMENPEDIIAKRVMTMAENAIILSTAAAVINFVSAILLTPTVMEQLGFTAPATGAETAGGLSDNTGSSTGIF